MLQQIRLKFRQKSNLTKLTNAVSHIGVVMKHVERGRSSAGYAL